MLDDISGRYLYVPWRLGFTVDYFYCLKLEQLKIKSYPYDVAIVSSSFQSVLVPTCYTGTPSLCVHFVKFSSEIFTINCM
jgi:hypothetical protein